MTENIKTTDAIDLDPSQSSADEMKIFGEKVPVTLSDEGQSITPSGGESLNEGTTTTSCENCTSQMNNKLRFGE